MHIQNCKNRFMHPYCIIKNILFILFLLLVFSCSYEGISPTLEDDADDFYWWPKQPIPKSIVVGKMGNTRGENTLLHSLSGLVAQSQKQGETNDLIWIEAHGKYDLWYSKLIKRTGATELGTLDVWQLLDRYRSLVKGYILYQPETWEVIN